MDPTVSRRGTCDKGDLEEAAGAADAGSYAFGWGVSKFVRLCNRRTAGVSMVGWSMGSE